MEGFKKTKTPYTRNVAQRSLRKRILIICEGEKTEKDYFSAFKIPGTKVEKADGRNNLTLVELAIQKKAEKRYDEIWCVFDRDSFPIQKFNQAILVADKSGIRFAISNECFELWYLLHFCLVTDEQTRKEYKPRLQKHLDTHKIPIKYDKQGLYQELKHLVPTAIKNAKTLLREIHVEPKETTFRKRYPGLDFAKTKPFTSVHDLVETLNKELEKIGSEREA